MKNTEHIGYITDDFIADNPDFLCLLDEYKEKIKEYNCEDDSLVDQLQLVSDLSVMEAD